MNSLETILYAVPSLVLMTLMLVYIVIGVRKVRNKPKKVKLRIIKGGKKD